MEDDEDTRSFDGTTGEVKEVGFLVYNRSVEKSDWTDEARAVGRCHLDS